LRKEIEFGAPGGFSFFQKEGELVREQYLKAKKKGEITGKKEANEQKLVGEKSMWGKRTREIINKKKGAAQSIPSKEGDKAAMEKGKAQTDRKKKGVPPAAKKQPCKF